MSVDFLTGAFLQAVSSLQAWNFITRSCPFLQGGKFLNAAFFFCAGDFLRVVSMFQFWSLIQAGKVFLKGGLFFLMGGNLLSAGYGHLLC
jgi:hypothetical protein